MELAKVVDQKRRLWDCVTDFATRCVLVSVGVRATRFHRRPRRRKRSTFEPGSIDDYRMVGAEARRSFTDEVSSPDSDGAYSAAICRGAGGGLVRSAVSWA